MEFILEKESQLQMKNLFLALSFFILGLLISAVGFAKDKKTGVISEVSIDWNDGTYEIAGGQDKGTYQSFGTTLSSGYKFGPIALGAEGSWANPLMSTDGNRADIDWNQHPLGNEEHIRLGLYSGLEFLIFRIRYTWFFVDELLYDYSSDISGLNRTKYTYEGLGEKVGVAITLFRTKGVKVTAIANQYRGTFDNYRSVVTTINSSTTTESTARSKRMVIKARSYGLAFTAKF